MSVFPREALDETLDYLSSPAALASLDADAYWPKWDSPWWRMLLLHEMGLTREIAAVAVEKLVSVLSARLVPWLPIKPEDVPAGKDKIRDFPCHCQLGTLYQVLSDYGLDVDGRLPWIRPWFLHYQLPDGGLNCDEAAYAKAVPRSSVVSTLPALEAILLCTSRPFTSDERRFLDRGAQYLLERRLWRSVSRGGTVIDESWGRLCFPRFYFYDLLRGLRFLVGWAERRGSSLPADAVREAVETMRGQLDRDGRLAPGRRAFEGAKTLRLGADGVWGRGEPARSFPLLDAVSASPPSPFLTSEWASVAARLD